jgi:putative hemolysin
MLFEVSEISYCSNRGFGLFVKKAKMAGNCGACLGFDFRLGEIWNAKESPGQRI